MPVVSDMGLRQGEHKSTRADGLMWTPRQQHGRKTSCVGAKTGLVGAFVKEECECLVDPALSPQRSHSTQGASNTMRAVLV